MQRTTPAAEQQVRSRHPGPILNFDSGNLSIPRAPNTPELRSLKNLVVKLLTQRKVKSGNTASGLNINCSGGFLSSGQGIRNSTRSISLADPLSAVWNSPPLGMQTRGLKRLRLRALLFSLLDNYTSVCMLELCSLTLSYRATNTRASVLGDKLLCLLFK